MTRIGLLGGMSWESSAEYYRLINEATRERLGGFTPRTSCSVGLLATAYTMEHDFYVGRLRDLHDLTVIVPDEPDRRLVHDVIYRELCVGVTREGSHEEYRRI